MVNNKICIYLRKSRADEELEKNLGEGETLSKHRKALLKFAKEKNLNIVDIKEEIVSGDSLFHRPKMLELLKEVEANMYSGVLVMDIDRLGRGGMKDQGVILEAFKESKTKIITPLKTFDLENEFDEEMTEFKTFFSRRELKVINRRMQGGRVRSIEDGNYIATLPPYGYDIAYNGKSRTLSINELEAQAVKIIFKMYVEGNGATNISYHLNSLGYKSKTNIAFTQSSVLNILKNYVYIGKVTWKKKDIKKSKDPNKVKDARTRDKSEWIIADGKHEPIISEELFYKAQEILKGRYHIPYQLTNGAYNPFAGVVICSKCKSKMMMRNLRGVDRLMCINKNCNNHSHRFDEVEKYTLNALDEYFKNYILNLEKKPNLTKDDKIYKMQLMNLTKELETLSNQKLRLFDLLEQGLYDNETFLERSNLLNNKIVKVTNEIANVKLIIENNINKNEKEDILELKKLLDGYYLTDKIEKKNEILKTVLIKIEYLKENKGKDFKISVFPRIKP